MRFLFMKKIVSRIVKHSQFRILVWSVSQLAEAFWYNYQDWI